jgi:hypothetical protein
MDLQAKAPVEELKNSAVISRILTIASILLTLVSFTGGSHLFSKDVSWLITKSSTIGIYGSCSNSYCYSPFFPSKGINPPLGSCNYY